jgi:DNA polymerase-4
VEPDRQRKSSGSEVTLMTDLTDPAAVEAEILKQADDVWAWCEKTQVFGHTVTVKLKYADFHQATRARTFARPVTDRRDLHEAALALTRTLYPLAGGVRLVGVTVSHFPEQNDAEPGQREFDFG